jgi:hypothetical protein
MWWLAPLIPETWKVLEIKVLEWIGREMTFMPVQGLLWRSNHGVRGPARDLEATVTYRLGVDKEGGCRSPKKLLDWITFNEPLTLLI